MPCSASAGLTSSRSSAWGVELAPTVSLTLSGAASPGRRFGGFFGRGFRVGRLRRGGGAAAGGEAQDEQGGENERENLFHFVFLL